MADTKLSALPAATPLVTDTMYLADDPGGTPVSKSVLISALDTLLSATAKTLTNKTLTSPVLTTPQINDTSLDHQYIFGVSELVADRTITLPLLTGNDIFTFNAFAATLTNKTLAFGANTISGTSVEFDTANTDGNFAFAGGAFHDGFSDFVSDEHIAHSGVTLTGGSGVAAIGTIAASRTVDLDFASEVADAIPNSADIVLVEDASVAGQFRKVTLANLPSSGISAVVDDTTPQLGGMLDVNGFALGDGTLELLKFVEIPSAINEITITNADIGSGPLISATGDDAVIDLVLASKSTGEVVIRGGATNGLRVTGSLVRGQAGSSFGLRPSANVTRTGPTFLQDHGDTNSGVGGTGVDDISLVCGGVEAVFYDETSLEIIQTNSMDGTITASVTQTQGQQPLISSYNEISIVANANDTVTLPVATEVGRLCEVYNEGANTLQIFPASGGDLGAGTDTATTVATGLVAVFRAKSATAWVQVI